MRRYTRDLKDIADFYNIKLDSNTSKSGKGLEILTNKQMLNRLPILLAQIEAGNNSIKLKNEARQILYSLYRSKVLTKTVYNNLIKSIRFFNEHYFFSFSFFSKHIHKDNFQFHLLLQTSCHHYNLEQFYLCFLYTQNDSRS